MLVSPTTNREATKNALDKLQFADRTATGEGIFTALQAIATVGAVIGGGDKPPPARIVLFSDGKETMPTNPDNPKGAFTAARTAKDQGVPISTISFGTPYGFVEINDQRQPVPVDDETLKKVAQLSGGNAYNAASLQELKSVYATLQQQIGYETIKGDASVGWVRLGALVLALAALTALLINRRLPTWVGRARQARPLRRARRASRTRRMISSGRSSAMTRTTIHPYRSSISSRRMSLTY